MGQREQQECSRVLHASGSRLEKLRQTPTSFVAEPPRAEINQAVLTEAEERLRMGFLRLEESEQRLQRARRGQLKREGHDASYSWVSPPNLRDAVGDFETYRLHRSEERLRLARAGYPQCE